MSATTAITPCPSSEVNAVTTSATRQAEAVMTVPTAPANFCKKVARDIMRYGVDEAMNRWRVVCDYLQTEPWWPETAEEVEALFDDAYEERNRREMDLANRQSAPFVLVSNNPAATNSVGINQADQVIASNMGNVAHTKYQ